VTQRKENPLSRKLIAAKATRERKRCAALRASDDPERLAMAARIVRAAIERGHLDKADLDGPIVQP
jgi:hypothetical protein